MFHILYQLIHISDYEHYTTIEETSQDEGFVYFRTNLFENGQYFSHYFIVSK